MLQTAHAAMAAALLLIYWAKLMRDLNTCFSAAVRGASFYTAETDAKNPADFYSRQYRDCSGADRVTLIIPEEQE